MATRLQEWCADCLGRTEVDAEPDANRFRMLTVVIPSHGRQDFLLRQLAYWSQSAARVIIVDGSPRALDPGAMRLFARVPTVRYLHHPGTIGERLKVAAGTIDTPYAVLAGDDEFLLKSGLAAAIRKLEGDSSLVACIGQSLGFHVSQRGWSTTYAQGYPHWRYQVTQATARERLLCALDSYNAASGYAVIRRAAWSQSWGTLRQWSSPYATELQQAMAMYIRGGLSTVDEVYWMRSFENPEVRTKEEANLKLSFRDWWASSRYTDEHGEFVTVLAADLADAAPASVAEARQAILDAIEAYLAFCRRADAARQATSRGGRLTRMRSRGSALARRVLPASRIAQVKRYVGAESVGPLGRLADLQGQVVGNAMRVADGQIAELRNMELLIKGFWEARVGA